jgi:hypothetical protein
MAATTLFKDSLTVVNVGLQGFADDIVAAGGHSVALQWQPPAQGDRDAGWALAQTLAHAEVEAANETALERFLSANPVLTGIATARDVLPGMADGRKLIVHAGPPIAWRSMCGPMQGAVLGAVVLEGWADSIDAATDLVERGDVALGPCHDQGAVGPMAGIISPGMPVFVVENSVGGNRAYCNFNEGLGKVLRFGANGPEVIARLRTMAQTIAPTLAAALARTGPIDLKPLMAQAINMGDEVHNRNVAATALFIKRIAPALLEADVARADAAATLAFVAGNDHFFLNLSMAASKAMCDAAAGVAGSSMVTAMARNGVNFGVRLSGTGSAWFEAPANPVDGLYFPATRSPTPPPTSATRRSPRPPASAASRWRRRRRSSSSSAARRPTRSTTACGCVRSRSASIRRSRCPRSTSPPERRESMRARSSTAACCR